MYTHEYNTQQTAVILKEYGRNVQKLVNFITIEQDPEKRAHLADTLVHLMKQLNPNRSKETDEYNQRLWNHLFFISNFELDLPSAEFEKPDASILLKKPETVDYNQGSLKYRHYGKNIELFIQKAIEAEGEDREAAIIHLGRIMKKFYGTWNKEGVEDEFIIKNIKEMSGGKLDIDVEKVKEFNLFYVKPDAKFPNNNPAPVKASNGRRSTGGGSNNGGRRPSNNNSKGGRRRN